MSNSTEHFPLHKCVFNDDIRELSQLIRFHDVSEKDTHGNTPLHLAVMLGHKDCVHLLLAHGASVKVKNSQGWTPLAEAISYGDRQMITSLLKKLKQQSRETLEERRPAVIQALKNVGDFCLELRWDFQSWVPLVSRLLPSDICKIHKKGAKLRMDTTLVDFNGMHWERGDISFVFDGTKLPHSSLSVLDNRKKVFQRIRYQETDGELEDEVDILMSTDIMAAQMSTKNITFTRTQSGWLFKEDKTELVGEFKADYYAINGLNLESRKRREHLSPEDIQKNKNIMEGFTKGSIDNNHEFERRDSLPAPQKTDISWEQYIAAPTGKSPFLSRQHLSKESSKSFKASVAMSENFPMQVEVLLDVLEVIAPFKQFQKLREFMKTKLPPGFPVKIEIPVFPTVTARVTFTNFEWLESIEDTLFEIPQIYKEDCSRFPDL